MKVLGALLVPGALVGKHCTRPWLLATDPILLFHMLCMRRVHLLIAIIRLILSVRVWPKVIILSSVCYSQIIFFLMQF